MTTAAIILFIIAAFSIGISKAGFSGMSLISVFILADLVGAKESLGIALPLLIVADLIVYPVFRKHGSWKQVWPLFLPTAIGMSVGFYMLSDLPNEVMRPVIGGIILGMVFLQLMRKFFKEKVEIIAHSKTFALAAASSGGVATVLANAAGPIFKLYFLSISLPKMELIGVCARFFLVVNLVKLPLNAHFNLINQETIILNILMIPFVVIGIFVGKKLVSIVSQKMFESLVLVFSIIAGIKMMFF